MANHYNYQKPHIKNIYNTLNTYKLCFYMGSIEFEKTYLIDTHHHKLCNAAWILSYYRINKRFDVLVNKIIISSNNKKVLLVFDDYKQKNNIYVNTLLSKLIPNKNIYILVIPYDCSMKKINTSIFSKYFERTGENNIVYMQ